MRPIVNMPEEDRATDIGNMHKKFGKDRTCGSGDILTDKQIHRQTYLSQYFATAPTGEVKIMPIGPHQLTNTGTDMSQPSLQLSDANIQLFLLTG